MKHIFAILLCWLTILLPAHGQEVEVSAEGPLLSKEEAISLADKIGIIFDINGAGLDVDVGGC